MSSVHLQIDEKEFLRHFVQNGPQLMWFLGAGTSRSSGLPAAVDLIWDLKRQYYCAKENQDVQAHNVSNHAIKAKIQSYFDGKGCPKVWSNEEYSYYFELMFGENYAAQQSYVQDQMSPDKVTLTIGPRALAGLLEIGRSRLIFTTNFDDVLEDAYAAVAGKNLTSFNLEGSYAALEALNTERFPLYAKIHGDFRYQNIKNLSKDLLSNDAEIQKCFVAAAGRYGLIVAGYSGRDSNVMAMLEQALSQPNPFPHGIWWTVPHASSVAISVIAFIEAARENGIAAHIVETGTFDVMLYKLWRQIPDRPQLLDDKVRSARAHPVSTPLPKPGKSYPILRTNALEIVDAPRQCGMLPTSGIPAADVFSAVREKQPDAVISYQDGIVFWGESAQVAKTLEGLIANDVRVREFAEPVAEIAESTYLKSLYEHGIAEALCHDKPILLRKKGKTYYAVVDYRQADDERFASLKKAIGFRGNPGPICGIVRELSDTHWSECVRLRLEERTGVLWLLLEPDVWIMPLKNREDARDFLRKRKLKRYNNQSYDILNAWIEILIGSIGQGTPVTVSYGADTDYPASFTVSTRTAFSRRASA
ncbi:MAG: SIR2 family protein [Desulfobacterales bacterium]|nr:SIR2 family protein [Desulfobacterales bacterium]